MWLHWRSLSDLVRYNSYLPNGSYGMLHFFCKLKWLKLVLHSWNLNSFGNVFANIKSAEAAVYQAELKYHHTQLAEDLIVLNAYEEKHIKLSSLKIKDSNGVWLDSFNGIAAHAEEFFQTLLSSNQHVSPTNLD